MSSQKIPQSLVCETCWSSLISTEAFRRLCHPLENIREGVEYWTNTWDIQQSAAAGCHFCSLILHVENLETASSPSHSQDVHVNFQPFHKGHEASGSKFTPIGMNRTAIFINQNLHRLTAFCTNRGVAGKIVTAREVDNKVNSEKSYDQIQTWLMECNAHEKCRPMEPHSLPSRVIEVGFKDYPKVPRLVATQGAADLYAALSYCWGSYQTGLTTLENVEQRMEQLDLNTLSQTARDAIAVTRRIGLKYLWIDALCIIQDSEEDKAVELASMCQTYQHAAITIVAANASNANQGFLQDRNAPSKSFKIPFWTPDGKLSSIFVRPEENYDDDEEPINVRAWTLQEQLLSSRLLIYASHTLQYHCQQRTVNLGNSVNEPPTFSPRRSLQLFHSTQEKHVVQGTFEIQASGRIWVDVITMYSQRNLSFARDKLTALAGVAEAFSSHTTASYLAGLWSGPLLPRLLLWRPLRGIQYAPSAVYTAPSWSWASLSSAVHFNQFHKHYNFEWFGEKRRITTNHIHNNKIQKRYHFEWHGAKFGTSNIVLENFAIPFGAVESGQLSLTGYVRRGYRVQPHFLSWSTPRAPRYEVGDDPLDTDITASLDEPSRNDIELICLAVVKRISEPRNGDVIKPLIDGLLISRLPGPLGKGEYYRIGTFFNGNEEEFKDIPLQTITLV